MVEKKIIKVKGALPHLQDIITGYIQNKSGILQLIQIKRYSSDIERYLESLETIDNEYTYAGIEQSLESFNFEFVPKVDSMGQYSRAGDTIAIWPIGYTNPIKIEFFDDEIETIYLYDPLYGKKLENIEKIFVGDIDILDDKVEWDNISIQYSVISIQKNKQHALLSELKTYNPPSLKLRRTSLKLKTTDLAVVIFTSENIEADQTISLKFSYPPLFYGHEDTLESEIRRYEGQEYRVIIETTRKENVPSKLKKLITKEPRDLSAGFIDHDNKIVYLTDRELFGTIFITREKKKRLSSKQAQKLLSEIEGEVQIGNYLVHEDHGIGIYSGITKEKDLEYLLLKYAQEDELLIPLDQIHKVTKYIGVSDDPPEITRLNKVDWRQVTKRVKKKIRILASELVKHYAQIELSKAKKIESETSPGYDKLINAFEYEETPDQERTIRQVLKDLDSTDPMNRLIVGDVGFGKTEVAMRAAFKVHEQGLQVAVMCPTTVLAAQHYKVFKDRFNKFDVKIAMMSRFSGTQLNSQTAKQLESGDTDIVIGTHRLLSNDIRFKNLGLIVIDEEQKFGVKQKEKLKKLKYGAHILSMTATPIPRTLSMALSEIQDISIISTPPEGRKAIKTVVEQKDLNKIASIVKDEVARGGQVYFIHNRVQTIEAIKDQLSNLLPEVKFVTGHGQMPEKKLEKVINDFYEKKYDVLVCTTIIENGIDMPNVNTIVINKAQNFGLGQLYQLRGRVGRSKRQAYAYLFYDGEQIDEVIPKVKIKSLNKKDKDIKEVEDDPQKDKKYIERLKAILEAKDLGAGFQIASRDLEIRGAGNLLGGEQHGNISKVGLGLYMQMLAEEIEKQKIAN